MKAFLIDICTLAYKISIDHKEYLAKMINYFFENEVDDLCIKERESGLDLYVNSIWLPQYLVM